MSYFYIFYARHKLCAKVMLNRRILQSITLSQLGDKAIGLLSILLCNAAEKKFFEKLRKNQTTLQKSLNPSKQDVLLRYFLTQKTDLYAFMLIEESQPVSSREIRTTFISWKDVLTRERTLLCSLYWKKAAKIDKKKLI